MTPAKRLTQADYAGLSEFRHQLRQFLRFSDEAAKSEGITGLQYQLLLQIRGQPKRWALLGELAERLHMVPHGVVALVTRCERAGLVTRVADQLDRRQVRVLLTPLGNQVVRRVAGLNRDELMALSGVLRFVRLVRKGQR
jgi:DNA-binding MarR family transcriptional regulator